MAKKEDKVEAVELPIESLMKKFSKRGGFEEFIPSRQLTPTGCLALDLKLGGGWGRDRVKEIYGPSGSFKTSISWLDIANYQRYQKDGDKANFFFVDLERSTLQNFARGFGVNTKNVWVEKPDTAEDAFNFISNAVRSGRFRGGIIDSIDAMESEEDVNKNYGEASMMKLPKLLSEAMRDLSKASVDYDCFLTLINQIRVGKSQMITFETTSGGNAIPFYASQRVRFAKKGPSKTNEECISLEYNLKKNKLSALVEAIDMVDFYPGLGFDIVTDYLSVGLNLDFVKQSGPYYTVTIDGVEVAKLLGKEKFGNWLLEDDKRKDQFKDYAMSLYKPINKNGEGESDGYET